MTSSKSVHDCHSSDMTSIEIHDLSISLRGIHQPRHHLTLASPQESVAVAPSADGADGMPETRKRKRAGKKKSGAQKKREKMSREEGPPWAHGIS